MTRKASTTTGANDQAEGAQAESVNPTHLTKLRARPAAAALPATEPANKQARPSRRDRLVRMLSTRSGTDLAAISAKFGWLPHTTRAALSGLRKTGYVVLTEKRADGKPTRYRIAVQAGSASPDDRLPSITGASVPEFPSYPISDGAAPTQASIDSLTSNTDNGPDPAAGAA